MSLYFPHDHPDNPDIAWSEACGLVFVEPVSARGKQFFEQTGFENMFISEKRLEETEHAIKEWNLVVDYDPEPDQETVEVNWIDKNNYDRAKVENWRRKFLTEEMYRSIT